MRPQLWPTPSPNTRRTRHTWRERLAKATAALNPQAAGAALGRLTALDEDKRGPDLGMTSPGAVAWFRASGKIPGYWNRHARRRHAREMRLVFADL